MGSLDSWSTKFNTVGWFIPPYTIMQNHSDVMSEMTTKGNNFTQVDLESLLARIYTAEKLSTLVLQTYPNTDFIKDYASALSDGIESHFIGLNYSAVSTILPVIEGVARKLAEKRGVHHDYIKQCIENVATDIKNHAVSNQLGAFEEIESMIDSFINFSKSNLYISSVKYPQSDKTNRHGILHGAYDDSDFGSPINFYKAIGCINVLCFLSAIDSNQGWMLKKHTPETIQRAKYYNAIGQFRSQLINS